MASSKIDLDVKMDPALYVLIDVLKEISDEVKKLNERLDKIESTPRYIPLPAPMPVGPIGEPQWIPCGPYCVPATCERP